LVELDLENNFGDFITLESIGKTYENRDIYMIKIDATEQDKDRKAILLTGAHHSRELVSVQMPMYSILNLLHGYVHGHPEKVQLLKKNKYYVIPVVNIDGYHTIYEEYMKTGELILKRKNNDRRFENGQNCPLDKQGVDINRNYGYLWGNEEGPCSESYPGPHAFSEPESKAMRSMLYKYQDDIKMVYNFHSFGPMYVWPYNG